MGCTQDHQLIANYLDFINTRAQVSIDNLSLNLLFYLFNLFHSLDAKQKRPNPGTHYPISVSLSLSKPTSGDKDKDLSAYASPVHEEESEEERGQSITSILGSLWKERLTFLRGITHITLSC